MFLKVLVLLGVPLVAGMSERAEFPALAARLPKEDVRAVAVQNSGLGLVLIFGFFGRLGGMAVIAGWWGTWHIIAGLTAAAF